MLLSLLVNPVKSMAGAGASVGRGEGAGLCSTTAMGAGAAAWGGGAGAASGTARVTMRAALPGRFCSACARSTTPTTANLHAERGGRGRGGRLMVVAFGGVWLGLAGVQAAEGKLHG